MAFTNPPNEHIGDILKESRTIAIVGLSNKEERDSNRVAKYLQSRGFRIIPVNPGQKEIMGEVSYPNLRSVPGEIDIVDVFRKSEAVPDIAAAAIDIGAKVLWLQQGVRHDEAAERAQKAGLTVFQDVCLMVAAMLYFK